QNKITQQGDFLVSSVETKESKLNPPLLFDLTTLQKEANKKLGYSADQTLSIAQALYEKKYITYPRTGSRYISQDILETIPDLIVNLATNSKFTAQALTIASLNHLAVNDSKVTDHHAILITETNSNTLKNEEEAIYNLIASRLLEAFSPECIKDITTVKIKSADVLFILKGAIIKQIGWKAVLNEIEEKQDEDFTLNMPPLTEGEILPLSAITTLKGQTKPKPLLTEASLLSQMETAGKDLDNEKEREAMKGLGLGTPATRAAIIETLITREYIKREKKSLVPTEKGLRVYELVKNMRISDIAMTGEWESTLSRIESTDISPETFQSAISIYTRQITEELLSSNIATQQDCPKCKTGKLRTYSKVIKCTNEQCQLPIFKEKSGKQITDLQISDLLTKGKTSIIKGFVSKSGKKFDASLAFDDQFQVVFVFDKKPFKKKDK
ncbi:MAG: type IA DNA topoisomerase, partial [Flavobacterium sp.]|nr:type IA DNA topoisomerase [Flavobacterium sp.]